MPNNDLGGNSCSVATHCNLGASSFNFDARSTIIASVKQREEAYMCVASDTSTPKRSP